MCENVATLFFFFFKCTANGLIGLQVDHVRNPVVVEFSNLSDTKLCLKGMVDLVQAQILNKSLVIPKTALVSSEQCFISTAVLHKKEGICLEETSVVFLYHPSLYITNVLVLLKNEFRTIHCSEV